MDLAKLIAERKDAIKSVCAKHGAHDVRVFGSVARGDFREGSDIDILVRLDSTNLEGMRYFGVLEELQEELESLLGRKVDVVDEKGLRQKIKADVLAEAIAL
jgi:predicted nucleotidyltransferase